MVNNALWMMDDRLESWHNGNNGSNGNNGNQGYGFQQRNSWSSLVCSPLLTNPYCSWWRRLDQLVSHVTFVQHDIESVQSWRTCTHKQFVYVHCLGFLTLPTTIPGDQLDNACRCGKEHGKHLGCPGYWTQRSSALEVKQLLLPEVSCSSGHVHRPTQLRFQFHLVEQTTTSGKWSQKKWLVVGRFPLLLTIT